MKILSTFFVATYLLVGCSDLLGQSTTVGKGWSENSINAVVFRKNSIVSFKQYQYVAYYDAEGFLTLAKRKHTSGKWKIETTNYKGDVTDAHRSISIMVDGKGYLHVAWNHHDSQLLYCKSKKPESLELSAPISMTGQDEAHVTYPEFYKFPNGDLFFLYRDGSSGRGNLIVNRYQLSTAKWTRVHRQLIDGENQRSAYWQACVDANGTFHISWVWRETYDVASNHDLCYAKTVDYGSTWQRSDNTPYTLPITQSTAEYVSRIPENSSLINQTSMAADEMGVPYIATYFALPGNSVPQYFMFYKNGESWKQIQMTDRKTPFTLGGGGTRKIPISRPQILVRSIQGQPHALLIFRDVDFDNKAVLTLNEGDFNTWQTRTLTDYSLESWEPSYDTELWRTKKKLHLYIQKVGQGDGETLEKMGAQDVVILEVKF